MTTSCLHQALIKLYGTEWAFDLGWLSLWALLHTQELYCETEGVQREMNMVAKTDKAVNRVRCKRGKQS